MKVGSSEPFSTHPLLHGLHAEESALRFIIKKLQYLYSLKDIYIFIWKQNANFEIKPAFCCAWCSKMLRNSGFPIKNVITINQKYLDRYVMVDKTDYIQSAICDEKSKIPLMKIKNSKRPMASILH